jgi:hypothetical protein
MTVQPRAALSLAQIEELCALLAQAGAPRLFWSGILTAVDAWLAEAETCSKNKTERSHSGRLTAAA